MKKGIECFVKAIRRDAAFAPAYTGLADCYLMLSIYSLPPREFVPKARMAVTRALEIDDPLAEAHASLGSLSFWYDWDFIRAEAEYRRAVELNPNLPEVYHWWAYLEGVHRRFDEAFALIRRAQNLDPLSNAIIANKGELLYRAGRYQESIAQCQKALEMDPRFAKAIYWRTQG
jgi:tetratricopeptide (TPR) repeat protein